MAGFVMQQSRPRSPTRARWFQVALIVCIGLPGAGCNSSSQNASLLRDEQATTGSVGPHSVPLLAAELGAEDLRRATGALAIALDLHGNGAPATWDNDGTGLKGSFVAAGKPFVRSDEVCRPFLATVAGQGKATPWNGTACRGSGGEWTIRTAT